MADVPELLDSLLRTPSPSGYEAPAAKVWRDAAAFADLQTDRIGSSIARVTGSGDGPLIAVVGHIDEIGLTITHVDEKGFAWFLPIGGWDAQILVGQRVEVQTRDGAVPGVVGRKPVHLLKDEQKKMAVELDGLHIDIGAVDRDDALELLRIGDPVVIRAEPLRLAGGRLVSRSTGQPARLVRGARGGTPLPRARRANRRRRRRRRGPGGDRPPRRGHVRVPAGAGHRGRGRRHPRHRRPRDRREGVGHRTRSGPGR